MQNEYIRALTKEIDGNHIPEYDNYYECGYNSGLSMAKAIAINMEVAPVKHGKWIHRKNWMQSVCSECSFESDAETKFCPNCGARMDGKLNWRDKT